MASLQKDSSNVGAYARFRNGSRLVQGGFEIDVIPLLLGRGCGGLRLFAPGDYHIVYAQNFCRRQFALRPAHIYFAYRWRNQPRHHQKQNPERLPNLHRFSLGPFCRFVPTCVCRSTFVPANRISGPVDTVCVSPSAATHTAAASGMSLTIALPLSGPTSSNVVDSASEAVPVFATM